MEKASEYHIPVLFKETLDNLIVNKDGIYVDCTLGGGGHSEGILERLSEKGKLICIDQDDSAIAFAKERLKKYEGKFEIYKDNFKNIDTVLYLAGIDKVDGILMDIGVSSEQLDNGERGFSYKYNAKLDMRMDKSQKLSAYEVVNNYSEEELTRIFFEYGEERFSRKIAKWIVEDRVQKPFETTEELANLVARAIPGKHKKHPAKRVFQAIRIEVNKELDVLVEAMEKSVKLLNPKGRFAIITFHSLEDRLVKNYFRDLTIDCICPKEIPICMCNHRATVKLITRKPIEPSADELTGNNRAHSSKLRVCERL